ncbi:MAG TPA: HAD-IC family P-type ATPase, partial [Candidatus Spyradenecus faecavium]|nr:HAD-IC family P-type ATPase [Candidatus Spyradenecus faecavium]
MSRTQRRELIRILIGLAVFAAGWCVPTDLLSGWGARAVFAAAYVLAGWDVLWASLRNILRGEVFDENFLMAVASIGAMALGDFAEGAAVMLFYQVGEWFQAYAVGRTRGSIAALMDIRPDAATVLRDGRPLRVDPEDVRVGETIRVRPGERVPLDGTVLVGESALDTAALTGESLPRPVMPGDPAPSGCINLSGLLEIRVDRHYGDSTVARILRLVEEASERKARTEAFITRFARVYTPFVCVSALLLALLPPLLFGGAWGDWVYRALTFLVISCPCALVISVPLSFFGGIGAASRRGVLLKGSNALETLAHVRAVVFDKTGTLTQGAFAVTRVLPAPGLDPDALLDLAAHAESAST